MKRIKLTDSVQKVHNFFFFFFFSVCWWCWIYHADTSAFVRRANTIKIQIKNKQIENMAKQPKTVHSPKNQANDGKNENKNCGRMKFIQYLLVHFMIIICTPRNHFISYFAFFLDFIYAFGCYNTNINRKVVHCLSQQNNPIEIKIFKFYAKRRFALFNLKRMKIWLVERNFLRFFFVTREENFQKKMSEEKIIIKTWKIKRSDQNTKRRNQRILLANKLWLLTTQFFHYSILIFAFLRAGMTKTTRREKYLVIPFRQCQFLTTQNWSKISSTKNTIYVTIRQSVLKSTILCIEENKLQFFFFPIHFSHS